MITNPLLLHPLLFLQRPHQLLILLLKPPDLVLQLAHLPLELMQHLVFMLQHGFCLA